MLFLKQENATHAFIDTTFADSSILYSIDHSIESLFILWHAKQHIYTSLYTLHNSFLRSVLL